MRGLVFAVASAALLAGCASDVASIAPPTPVGSGSAPVLDAISLRTITEGGFPVVIPEFRFHDPDGDVSFIARELVESDGPYQSTKGAAVTLPAAMQQRGAVFAGHWACGANRYHAVMRAYLIDRAGNRSNAMSYTVHCNGG